MKTDIQHLLQKYDVPTPRYTSYPTVPFWNNVAFNSGAWTNAVAETFTRENGELSIYVHLPFCEELCTYCACNKRITKNHAVEEPYLETVLKEWRLYKQYLPGVPIIREIHLGGGTPTFFSPEHLTRLIEGLTAGCTIAPDHEFSVEVHPNYTTREHLKALQSVGFNRISLGVQDFDPKVQYVINRIQSFEKTKAVVDWARELGYFSVNTDLIYGLPLQTLDSIRYTFERVGELMPDRIAFYSYAHVPWKSKVQRRYSDDDIPKAELKLQMYSLGNNLLTDMGFVSIGMDHFALPTDKLLTAFHAGQLHRNFMGYTTTNNKLVIGLGASSIGDTWHAFGQNEKEVEAYQERVGKGEFPLTGGHLLNDEDMEIRKHILNLMCTDQTNLAESPIDNNLKQYMMERLKTYEADGLLQLQNDMIRITPQGKLFIRNICSSLDAYLYRNKLGNNLFSKAI